MARAIATCLPLLTCLALAAEGPEKPTGAMLGPEWTKCKCVHPLDGQERQGYIRLIAAAARRHENGGPTNHTLGLDRGGRLEIEAPDDKWSNVTIELFGRILTDRCLQFNKNLGGEGISTSCEVRFGSVSYFDLNGDGSIDCWVDAGGDQPPRQDQRRSFILFEGRVVEVEYFRTPFAQLLTRDDPPIMAAIPPPDIPIAWAEERKKRYDFFDGKWTTGVWKPAPDQPADPTAVPVNFPKFRVLGPEWIKIKQANPQGGEELTSYIRPGANVSYRKENDASTRHTLILDHGGGIDVYERDDNSAITIELIGKKPTDRQFYFNRQLNEKGVPTRHEVRFGPVTYFDLDGDGMIDCWVDTRGAGRSSHILLDGRVVRVEDSKSPFVMVPGSTLMAWGEGRKVRYEFAKGKWSAVKP